VSAARRVALGDGVEVAYRDEGAGEPLLLIHGITESQRAWDELAGPHAREARVLRVDLPGHGESSPLPEYSAGALTAAVARFVTALGLERPRVIGHSLGGVVATLLGAFTPVRSVVSVDQPLRLGSFLSLVRGIAPRLAGASFADAMNEEMEVMAGPALPARLRDELRAYRVPERRPVVLGMWLPLVDQTEERILETLRPLLAQLRAPYLSLHGLDPGPGYEAWLRAALPSCPVEVELWPGQGHWLHRIEPERFVARVRAFHAKW
jgi:pimeloyl-ACP methyl ester carboxylesterase